MCLSVTPYCCLYYFTISTGPTYQCLLNKVDLIWSFDVLTSLRLLWWTESLFYLIIWIISTCYMASDILPFFCFFPVWSETTLQVCRADGVCWLRACCLWAEKVSGWVWVDFTPLTIPWGFSHHHHQQRQAQFSSSTCMEIVKADETLVENCQ